MRPPFKQLQIVTRMKTDGTGFEDVNLLSTNVGGVAATTDGGAYWSYSPATTTLFYGTTTAPVPTFYDTAGGNAGIATSDGTSLYYFAFELVVSTPKPIRTPWPAELLSVAGSTIAGGSQTAAVRANTDGGGFEEVSGQAARIGGVAATADGVFWTQAAETTTSLVGSVPAAQTVYDSVVGADAHFSHPTRTTAPDTPGREAIAPSSTLHTTRIRERNGQVGARRVGTGLAAH